MKKKIISLFGLTLISAAPSVFAADAVLPFTPEQRRALAGRATLVASFAGTVLEAPAEPGMRAEAAAVLMKLGRLDLL